MNKSFIFIKNSRHSDFTHIHKAKNIYLCDITVKLVGSFMEKFRINLIVSSMCFFPPKLKIYLDNTRDILIKDKLILIKIKTKKLNVTLKF